MTGDSSQPPYLLGHSQIELDRLERQSRFFDDETGGTLVSAGLAPGMNVLDVGCGAGDVSIAAARLVGPSGSVMAVDTSSDAVALANERFARHGLAWAKARVGDAHAVGERGFDAGIGRFILMHLSNPSALLRALRAVLKPGGVLAFLEMDIASASITPPLPLFDAGVRAIVDVYRASGSEPNMGSRLYATYRQAGLSPTVQGSCRVEGGGDAHVFDYLARSVVSLAPAMRAHDVETPMSDLDGYADALRAAARTDDYFVAHPRLVAAWAHV